MKIQSSLQWLLVVSTCASQTHRPVRLARAPVLKYTNSSIQSTAFTSISPSIFTTDLVSSDDPDYQILTLPPAVSTKQSDCIANSTITYFSSIYPTIYVTVEGSYEVTVTASNVSVTDAPTIFETPATACVTTVLSPEVSGELITGSPESDSPLPLVPTSSDAPEYKGSRTGSFPVLTVAPPALSAETAVTTFSVSYDGLRLTSTVTVTKKTPVPVVQVPQDTNPPVTFKQVPTTQSPQNTEESLGQPPVSTPSPNDNNNSNSNNGKPGTDNNNNNNGGGGNNLSDGNGSSGGGSGVSSPPAPTDNNSPSPTPPPLAGAQAGASKLGEIIASIINSPFVAPVPVPVAATLTSPPAAVPTIVPTIATIDGIAVTVNAPNIIIGGSVVTIPTGAQSQATVQVNGQTFTVLSNQIIAPGTTYDLIPTSAHNLVAITTPAIFTQSASIVTANGIVLTVGPTQAIVSGTTYQIGPDAPNTYININGQTISLGNNGVGFTSTTFAPAITIAENKYKLVTAEDLTFSIDASEAIISGTTYNIGPSAKQSTIVIGTKTVMIGSNGLVLASATVNPTSVPTISAATTSGTSTGSNSKDSKVSSSTASPTGVSSSASAALRNSASSISLVFPSSFVASVYMPIATIGFGFLPVLIALLV